MCYVVGMKLKNTLPRSSNACRRLWSKQCSEGYNLRYIQEGLVNFTRGLAWDLICGLVNWTALQHLLHSLSITSCVLFSQTSFLVRDRRSSASHLSVSVGSSCGGGKCMFCFFVSLCVPILTLGTKSTGTDMEKTEWDPTGTFPCHYFSFVWMEWNMPGGLEPLKSIYPGKRDKIQKTSKLPPPPPSSYNSRVKGSTLCYSLTRTIPTYKVLPDLSVLSFKPWASLGLALWFYHQMGKSQAVTEKMILEEFGRCLLQIIHTANGTKGKSVSTCFLSCSNLQHMRVQLPSPSPPFLILLVIGRQICMIPKVIKRNFVHVNKLELGSCCWHVLLHVSMFWLLFVTLFVSTEWFLLLAVRCFQGAEITRNLSSIIGFLSRCSVPWKLNGVFVIFIS